MSGVASPLRKTVLFETDGIAIEDVRCSSPKGSWSQPEQPAHYSLVFVRRGCFRRLTDDCESLLDPVSVYFERPGQVQRFAHPNDDGDTCTQIVLAEGVLTSMTGGELDIPNESLLTSANIDLEHRLLLATVREPVDRFAITERVLRLVGSLFARARPEIVTTSRSSTIAARRRTVDAAREALAADPGLGLLQLARAVAVSPHHLSRIFRAETGETISRYRNRVRVRLALERLAEGDDRLARLARDLGFADQAHLSRVVRKEVGSPPSWLRSAFVERLR
jgi:AraC-like DNA-binding protein